ncbi:MAG: hypothetical protein ACLGI6_00245 [Gammaproteobacteria bacterium]
MPKPIAAVVGGICMTFSTLAQAAPALGLVEYVPIIDTRTWKVSARPIYIFTDTALTGPTVFSALRDTAGSFEVECCFEVVDVKPVDIEAEVRRYPGDGELGEHVRSIKGHTHVYRAQTVAKARWSPAMKLLMSGANDPEDGVPFSEPVVAATFDKPSVPASFDAGGTKITLRPHYNQKTRRATYTFTQPGKRSVFQEDMFPH